MPPPPPEEGNEPREESSGASRPISERARIDIEEPPRKMRLMFGERQVVFLRSDGLRSRVVRENLKKKKEEERKKSEEKIPQDSANLTRIIEEVARNGASSDAPGTSAEPPRAPETPGSAPENSDAPEAPGATEISQDAPGPSSTMSFQIEPRKNRITVGNRTYHPPRKFHATSTMVEHTKRWTYQMARDINAAEQSDDGQMYYIADPFLPMPRGRRNEVCTASRMNFAAQRLDNRKFRAQMGAVKGIADNESVTCQKCGMRYFFESLKMQERISYLQSANEEDLPTVLFECPVCKVTTRASS